MYGIKNNAKSKPKKLTYSDRNAKIAMNNQNHQNSDLDARPLKFVKFDNPDSIALLKVTVFPFLFLFYVDRYLLDPASFFDRIS
jgi:hypothetical protein